MANASFVSVAFEVVLLAGTLIVLFVGVVAGRNRSVWGPVAGLFFLLSAVAGLWQWVQGPGLGKVKGHPDAARTDLSRDQGADSDGSATAADRDLIAVDDHVA